MEESPGWGQALRSLRMLPTAWEPGTFCARLPDDSAGAQRCCAPCLRAPPWLGGRAQAVSRCLRARCTRRTGSAPCDGKGGQRRQTTPKSGFDQGRPVPWGWVCERQSDGGPTPAGRGQSCGRMTVCSHEDPRCQDPEHRALCVQIYLDKILF